MRKSLMEARKVQENTQTIQRCKSLNFRALFAFGTFASKTRKSRFIRLAVKLSAGYLRPPNGAPKGIGRDGRRSENAPKVFGHNGTLRGNKRAREREGDGGHKVPGLEKFSHLVSKTSE